MVVTYYYIKLFCAGGDRDNGILMSLLLLFTETTKFINKQHLNLYHYNPTGESEIFAKEFTSEIDSSLKRVYFRR